MKGIFNLLVLAVALMSAGIAMADADGHCNYAHDSAYSDVAYKICKIPMNPADCAALGSTEGNADAVYADGECSTEATVGTCDMGESKLVYYNGDADGLETGCGFQSGDWVNAE